MRKVEITRNTKETKIKLTLNVDGSGKSNIDTKVGFLDHMLTLFASHGKFDLDLVCDGDVDVDFHHTTEDIGIALGEAFEKAIGDKKGINRYANIVLPMDEALVMCSVDVSGRDYYNYGLWYFLRHKYWVIVVLHFSFKLSNFCLNFSYNSLSG